MQQQQPASVPAVLSRAPFYISVRDPRVSSETTDRAATWQGALVEREDGKGRGRTAAIAALSTSPRILRSHRSRKGGMRRQ